MVELILKLSWLVVIIILIETPLLSLLVVLVSTSSSSTRSSSSNLPAIHTYRYSNYIYCIDITTQGL